MKKVFLSMVPLVKREFNVIDTLNLLKIDIGSFLSLGISQLVNFNNKGIGLKVDGKKHKGYVFISLDYTDTYTVDIITKTGKIKQTFEMIYFDQLLDTLTKSIVR